MTDHKIVRLQNEHIALAVVPTFGARITELVDRHTGRDWLVHGKLDVAAGENVVFGTSQACGWDECFPTVAPCNASDTVWGRQLRDHGALWGCAWDCVFSTNSVLSSRSTELFRFQRKLTLNGNRIELEYELENRMHEPMPWLWSQHCLLKTIADDSLTITGLGLCTATYLIEHGTVHQPSDFHWPNLGRDHPVQLTDLSVIRDCDARFALKAYAQVIGEFSAVIGDSKGQIQFAFTSENVPFVGIWLDYGGWPDSNPVHQIAIEPTNAPVDDLQSAMSANHSIDVPANSRVHWSVSVSLLGPTDETGE